MDNAASQTPAGDCRLDRFYQLYTDLGPGSSKATLNNTLAKVYHNDVTFVDPMHRVQGLSDMERYFSGLYENITSISFAFHRALEDGNHSTVHWTMSYRHPQLYGGKKEINVEGVSLLTWQDDHIVRHQDIFDAGALLYEHLPVLGWIIRKLKERMA